MKFDYGNGEIEIEISFYALLVYEQEFGGDMIQDLFGRIVINQEDSGEIALDYTQTNWTATTKALWACAKTANDNVQPYKQWARTMTNGVNMYSLSSNLIRCIEQELFRLGTPADTEVEEEQ